MNVLGISCFYHNSAACLIQDGVIASAAQEERFTREKATADFPINAVHFCLAKAGLTIYDIDYIGFYEKPFLKFSRVITEHLRSYPFSSRNFLDVMPHWLNDRLIFPLLCEQRLNYRGKVLFVKHHLTHAASSFLVSPFEEAAILTVDGVGEWATTCFGIGNGNSITMLKELSYPHSLGLLYTAVTTYLGFKPLTGEGKVMALAGYGQPSYIDVFKKMIDIKPDGSFWLNTKFLSFNKGRRMYSKALTRLLGKGRKPDDAIEQRHYDIAASLQKLTEEILVAMATNVYRETKLVRLCLAGGVFLNCLANAAILEKAPFKEIFIQPAASDCGGALGVAAYIYHALLNKPRNYTMTHACLGLEFSVHQIKRFLSKKQVNYKEFSGLELPKYIAQKIVDNKIIGWFQGRMEWGPRALGNRSILANPCHPDMQRILNEEIKHRENFRPYGVSILLEEVHNYFDLGRPSPFMLLVGRCNESKRNLIPSAVHVDGTSRIQTISKKDNGIFYDLVKEFYNLTGVPMVINTSFNTDSEPIVCSPQDAYACFLHSKIDFLVLGNCVVEKTES